MQLSTLENMWKWWWLELGITVDTSKAPHNDSPPTKMAWLKGGMLSTATFTVILITDHDPRDTVCLQTHTMMIHLCDNDGAVEKIHTITQIVLHISQNTKNIFVFAKKRFHQPCNHINNNNNIGTIWKLYI